MIWRRIVLSVLLLSLFSAAQSPLAALCPQGDHKKKVRAETFIIFGTVFSEKGFALPGAEIRLRRKGEKKDRWQARSDSRGEFALRVPPGAEYELSIRAPNYGPETRDVDARQSSRVDLTIRLEPQIKGKPSKEKPSSERSK